MTQWGVCDIELTAGVGHDWWDLPVKVVFAHSAGAKITLEGFSNGGRTWLIRFAPTLAGEWRYTTSSSDPGLDGECGVIHAQTPTKDQIAANAGFHGYVTAHRGDRYFRHDDGTPFLWLGDTIWSASTSHCGLGGNGDGPFHQYLSDRKRKGFTLIQMEYMRGFGDAATEPAGQKNEGGYPFISADVRQLSALYFAFLDRRIEAISADGLAIAAPPTWWGKEGSCLFSLKWAKRIGAYLTVRYGAYSIIWSVSGEYQYAFEDCGWSEDDFGDLATEVELRDAYDHPISIHPNGRTHWEPPHNVQSSQPYHNQGCHDHNWLQTGQWRDSLCNAVRRSPENYALVPANPVVHAEGYYERASDPDHAYHSRWQAWCAFLNGALGGHTYGAWGMWEFYDPDGPDGETGKVGPEVVHWAQALGFEGSSQLCHARQLLGSVEWWRLVQYRDRLAVDGSDSPLPTESDITAPQCAAIPGELYIIYIPRGNGMRSIEVARLTADTCSAHWVDPRSGMCVHRHFSQWTIPLDTARAA